MNERIVMLTTCAKFSKPDVSSCIICQRDSKPTASSENGRKRIRAAAEIRNDCVLKRLKLIGEEFVYHMNNECYKKYTLRKSLEKIKATCIEGRNKDKIVGATAKTKSVCHVPSKRVTRAQSIKESLLSKSEKNMRNLWKKQKSGYLSEISNI